MPPKSKTTTKKPTANKKNTEPPKVTNSANTSAETTSGLSQEAEDQLELELCWCIQQLEMCLATGKLPEKQAHDLNKNINILKSNTAPLIKKRQIMRNTLGNYREKMAQDEQKLAKTASSIKFMPAPTQNKKCTFLRKTTTKQKQHSESDKVPEYSNDNFTNIANVKTTFKFNFQINE